MQRIFNVTCRLKICFLVFFIAFQGLGLKTDAQVGGTTTANGISGSLDVTPGSVVNFAAQGGSNPAAGITFSWEYSATGVANTYTAISGQTNAACTDNSFSRLDKGYYRRVTRNGALSANSVPVQVTANYYCSASSNIGNADPVPIYPWNLYGVLGNVKINTLDNASLIPAYAPFYTSYIPAGTSLAKGVSYGMSVAVAGRTTVEVWIDWNQDGIFENTAPEYTLLGAYLPGSLEPTYLNTEKICNSIFVPANAVSGTTVMRVRGSSAAIPSTKPCGNTVDGEVEDYQITVVDPGLCSGLPPIAITTATATTVPRSNGVSSVCPGTLVNFGLSTVNNATGITYQWYNNAGAIPGATKCVYTTAITVADNFHCDITCTNSGQTRSSTTVPMTLIPWIDCYCTPTANQYYVYGGSIVNVKFTSPINPIDNSSMESQVINGYSNYKYLLPPAIVTRGSSVPIFASSSDEHRGYVWIDYNHNGFFEESEASELSADTDYSDPFFHYGTVNIPNTALLGPTVIRYRLGTNIGIAATWIPIEAWNQCSYSVTGEAEDYMIQITAPCNGTPNPGNTIASANPACANTNVALSFQNYEQYQTGLTYQWYNLSGAIPGATGPTYTVIGFTATNTYFCKVTCTLSGATSFSTAIQVAVNTTASCSCTAGSSAAPATNGYSAITNVTFNTLNNTTTVPATAPYYTSYAPMGTTVNRGSPYPGNLISVTIAQFGKAGAWFDWNKNGVFENNTNEFVYLGNNSGATPVTFTQTVNVPADAIPGITPMRVRSEYFLGSLDGTNACGNTLIGETEDYAITVLDTTAKNYTFTGNGNWNVASNWANNAMPPGILSGNDRITIDPPVGGECVLNIVQRVNNVSQITVKAGKKMRIAGNLIINR